MKRKKRREGRREVEEDEVRGVTGKAEDSE